MVILNLTDGYTEPDGWLYLDSKYKSGQNVQKFYAWKSGFAIDSLETFIGSMHDTVRITLRRDSLPRIYGYVTDSTGENPAIGVRVGVSYIVRQDGTPRINAWTYTNEEGFYSVCYPRFSKDSINIGAEKQLSVVNDTTVILYSFLKVIAITDDTMRCDLQLDNVRIRIPAEIGEKTIKTVSGVTNNVFWKSSTGKLHIESRLAGKMMVYDLSGRIFFMCNIVKGKQYISLNELSRSGGIRVVRISTPAGNTHQLLRF